MSMSMNLDANKSALAKKDETIANLIALMCETQTNYKAALAKKDETIERLILLLSKELPVSSDELGSFKAATTSAPAPAPAASWAPTPAASSWASQPLVAPPTSTGYSFGKTAPVTQPSQSTGYFGVPAQQAQSTGYSFGKTESVTQPAQSTGFAFGKAATSSSGLFSMPSASTFTFGKPATASGIHPGISCDRSGMMPIVGTRYHLTGYNYDLCQAEYDKLSADEKSQYEAMAPP